MAAYGSLVSLMRIIDQLQHHPSPPISLDKHQLQSLTESITFLQEFLDGYNSQFADSEEADPFEIRIVNAAYAAEDVIESYIVRNIKLDASKSHDEQISCTNFYQDLQKVIEEMDLIKKVAMEITTEKSAVVQDVQLQRKPNVPASVGLNNNTMVGFDETLREIMNKLIPGRLDRQVIPIVGMGGSGKTTLAKNLYARPLVTHHFHICVWVTISQQFNSKEILCEVLSQASKGSRGKMDEKSEEEVQLAVYQYLSHRRFLIVLDDMWSIDPWNKIQRFFPDNNNGSRILVTTRLSQLGSQLDKSNTTLMKFLDEDSSWALFSQTVFGEESFPLELVEIGKKIVESCKGLPLSIAVIGGLLKKLQHTQECWESIGKNLNSALSSESDEYCLKILKMSYNHLPAHLKPCFLYMGVFEEDCEIRVPELVRLWISEGFVKPISGKSLEISTEEYLKDLVGRNLLVAHKLKSDGNIQFCKIHDLLREVCLREAQKEKFYHVIEPHMSYPAMNRERCIVIRGSSSEEKVVDALQSMPHARSLICDNNLEVGLKPNCGLLRSLHALDVFRRPFGYHNESLVEDVFELVNLRYLAVVVDYGSKIPCSINLLWNLQTLIVDNRKDLNAPPEFWNMSQLRHVHFSEGLCLPDPPSGNNDIVIMENLQTLKIVLDFKCSEEVVKRIPNIKNLHINYSINWEHDEDDYCLNNLSSLHKLEYLRCYCDITSGDHLHNLTFPQSLQKLTLHGYGFDCEKALEKIGSLPLLQKLVLHGGTFKRRKLEIVEGEFRSLRFLSLSGCDDLERWEMADCSHFPRLEHLILGGLEQLEEIPREIGEIATLKSVALEYCSESAVKSMKKIVEEQEDLQGEEELGFHVRVELWEENEALQSLASPNFEVQLCD